MWVVKNDLISVCGGSASFWIEINWLFVSGHRNRLDIRVGIKIDMISVMGSKLTWFICAGSKLTWS